MVKFNLMVLFSIFTCSLSAARVEYVKIYSASMGREIDCSVVIPETIAQGEKAPAIYLLHGHGGNYRTWVKDFDTEKLADQYGVFIISPDGNRNSWYWDSPIDSTSKYETFVSKELVAYIDKQYPTIPTRDSRAISGFSMGGHGALYIAMRHQETFGAVGSMSGGVDILPFPKSWEMEQYLGTKAKYPKRWFEYSVMGQLHRLTSSSLEIIIDCGREDFFFEVNESLNKAFVYNNIPHTYIIRKGSHNLTYWQESLPYHVLFFDNYFNKIKN